MDNRVAKYLILSQLVLLIFLIVCTALLPGFLFSHNEGGMSNYGVHAKTIVPYTLGFLLCSICIGQAARLLPHTTKVLRIFRRDLYAAACLFLFVLITTYPYQINTLFGDLHLAATIAIFWFQTGLAVWMTFIVLKDKLSLSIFALELVGFSLAFLTFLTIVHLLFVSQIITGATFGILLVRTGQRLAGGLSLKTR
jgi:hypothetical protein